MADEIACPTGARLVTMQAVVRRDGDLREFAVERVAMIAEARAGNATTVGVLLESYRNYLRVLAELEIGRRLRRKVDASDIVQETFLEAHRQFPRFQGAHEKQLTEWLRTILAGILANTMRRYFGTQARDLRLEEDLAGSLNQSSCRLEDWAVDPRGTPSVQLAQLERMMLVSRGLAKLPVDYREVLVMRHLEGLPFAEIAARLERSVDSVEKLWVRGVAKLKAICTEGNSDGPA